MTAPDISLIQASMKSHVTTALTTAAWNIQDGAPRGYVPPQVNIWLSGVRAGPPMELQEVLYEWTVRLVADRASDPERQDVWAVAWEAIWEEWEKSDAISCGGNAQESFPHKMDPFEVESDGLLYVGVDIVFTVIVKRTRIFTLT